MEMKEVLDREGRDAKNVLMYQFIEDTATTNISGKISPFYGTRKPPLAPPKMLNLNSLKSLPTIVHTPGRLTVKDLGKGPRVRSASTGRDKKSELQARYWALLFGNLQRAVNEIYQTVECYENISSCQEAILVLENYVRDFKALGEWFKVSWDYESRPLQLRPLSLAWEVRKSNPLPRVRAKSLSSPTTESGKSSPCAFHCNSGKSSPCCMGDNLSPKRNMSDLLPRGAVRVNVRDLFASNKVRGEIPTTEQPPNRKVVEIHLEEDQKNNKYSQTDMEDDHLTLADILEREKQREEEHFLMNMHEEHTCEFIQADEVAIEQNSPLVVHEGNKPNVVLVEIPTAVTMTVAKLDAMENAVLEKDAMKTPTLATTELRKPETQLQPQKPVVSNQNGDGNKKNTQPTTNVVPYNGLKYSSVLNRPAVIRNNNKPVNTTRPSTAGTTTVVGTRSTFKQNNTNIVTPDTLLRRSATTVNNTNNNKSINRGNIKPLARNITANNKFEKYGPPTHVATRLSARSRTMLDINKSSNVDSQKMLKLRAQPMIVRSSTNSRRNSSQKSSREDIGSSNATLKASTERISSTASSRNNLIAYATERRSEPKQSPSESNDGWLTVKNRRRSSMHWANRFNQPTGYASLPTLALSNEKRQDEEQKLQQKQQKLNNKEQKQVKKSNILTAPKVNENIIKNKLSKEIEPENHTDNSKMDKDVKNMKAVVTKPEIKSAKAKVNSLRKTTNVTNGQTKKTAVLPICQTVIKRQRSDLTGLKITSLHKEYMRSEKNAQRRLNGPPNITPQKANQSSTEFSSTETVIDG